MRINRRGQLFTMDLLLALVPITIILGVSANAMSGMVTSEQEYSFGFGMNRIAMDMASVVSKNPDVGLAADIDATADIVGGEIIEQTWAVAPLYQPGSIPMNFTYINASEWWVPFKENAISRISVVDGRNILDVATMSRNMNLSTVDINGVNAHLLNAAKLSILSGGHPFKLAVVPIRNKTAQMNFNSMENIGLYNFSIESVPILPYAELGNISKDVFAVQIPVLSMFDESSGLSRYDSFKSDVYSVPIYTDSSGNGAVFVIFDDPQIINKSEIGTTDSFNLEKTGLPMPITNVTLSRKNPYASGNDNGVLNGTVNVYVNSIKVFNGTLDSTENKSITETFVPDVNPGANIVKIIVENSKPDANGMIFLTIQCSDMWVSQRIFMMPAYLIVLVSGGSV
ncbi:hypothetical protein BMS3Bbin15_00445 [archaeon BMS3Bbin15]|nr:hypothetical protein BMS3Bbin15_00445 [archaeon BMS3Bbin15]